MAGQIQYFWDRWKKITTDRNLLYMVKHGCSIEFDSSPCDQCSRVEIRFNLVLSDFINLTQVHNFTVSAQDIFTFRRFSVFTVSFTRILQ